MKRDDKMLENLVIEKLMPTDERILEVINLLTEENFNFLVQTQLNGFNNLKPELKDKFKGVFKEQIRNYYLSFDNEAYVAYLGNMIIGAILRDDDYLDSLFVRKEYRNQKIGSSLLEKVLDDCKEYKIIRLDANINEVSLYQKYGFCPDGQIRKESIVSMVLKRK